MKALIFFFLFLSLLCLLNFGVYDAFLINIEFSLRVIFYTMMKQSPPPSLLILYRYFDRAYCRASDIKYGRWWYALESADNVIPPLPGPPAAPFLNQKNLYFLLFAIVIRSFSFFLFFGIYGAFIFVCAIFGLSLHIRNCVKNYEFILPLFLRQRA